jgi:hypothetical protein
LMARRLPLNLQVQRAGQLQSTLYRGSTYEKP